MLKIIDKYIIKQFLLYFASALIVFCMLYLAIDFMTIMAKYSGSMSSFTEYYLLITPSVIYRMTPIACIIAVIFTLSDLNKTNELIVLFSSGLSLARVCLAPLICVAIISFSSFIVADKLLPKLDQKADVVFYTYIKKIP